MGGKKIELRSPVQVHGVAVGALEMREPKVRDQLAAEAAAATKAEQELHLFAALCDVEPETLRELTLHDYKRLAETFEGFLS